MKIEIIYHYAETDPEFTGECVIDFIVDGFVIYGEQDEYHNKISSKIEGFLEALSFLRHPTEITKSNIADCELLND